ncbi:MAG: DUF4296 domain-containing protein [Ignavibacteriales bacterium]|nr:DUF4296 domain-containing protein [Ignavibacteriales bacterium]HOJ19080.1 DUF4296 domain-containing protein [Ignavibacteriaceae bacterium]
MRKFSEKYYWGGGLLLVILAVLIYFRFSTQEVIPEEKFMLFYIDFVTAQDSMGTDVPATKKILYSLYKKYSVDSTLYHNTINWYSKDPKRWEQFFDSTIKMMEERNNALRDSLKTLSGK